MPDCTKVAEPELRVTGPLKVWHEPKQPLVWWSEKLTLPVAAAGETVAVTLSVPWLGELTLVMAIVVAIGTEIAVLVEVDGWKSLVPEKAPAT